MTAAATPALAQTILRGLTFTNVSGNPAATPSTPEDRTLTVTVNDGAATSTPKNWTVTVVPVDSPPVVEPLTLAVVPGLSATAQVVAHDPEGQALTYLLLEEQTKGTVTMTSTGLVTYRNTVLDGQNDSFRVQVTSTGQSTMGTVSVRVSTAGASSGRFTSTPPLVWREGVIFSYTPTVAGFGNAPQFHLEPAPQVAKTRSAVDPLTYSFDANTGTLTIPAPISPELNYLRFGIVAVDPVTHESAYQPILLKILVAGDG